MMHGNPNIKFLREFDTLNMKQRNVLFMKAAMFRYFTELCRRLPRRKTLGNSEFHPQLQNTA